MLKKDIDTHFRPGIDDWQFTNYGSIIAQNGHCSGQSLTALWYYVNQPDGKDLTLYGRYDNNGDKPATPDLWYDDSNGYRFCSVIHKDINWKSFENKFFKSLGGVNDEMTWKAFAYAMYLTDEPQFVGIRSNAGGGHAMICYRIYEGNLYIADPNYPGNTERRIEYQNGSFTPYNSGANAEEIANGNGKNYEKVYYFAKTCVVNWNTIAQRWTEFKNGTIGDNEFPMTQIFRVDQEGKTHPLEDGYVSPSKLIKIDFNDQDYGIVVFRDQRQIFHDGNWNYELNPGNNLLGIYVSKEIERRDRNGNRIDSYIDFEYFNVIYEDDCEGIRTTEEISIHEPDPGSELQYCSNPSFGCAMVVNTGAGEKGDPYIIWTFSDGGKWKAPYGNTLGYRVLTEGPLHVTAELYYSNYPDCVMAEVEADYVVLPAPTDPYQIEDCERSVERDERAREFKKSQGLVPGQTMEQEL